MAAGDEGIVIGVVGMKERERCRLVDHLKAEHVDKKARGRGKVGAVDVDVGDLARSVADVGAVRNLAHDREIAPFRIGQAEAIAAAGPIERMGRFARPTGCDSRAMNAVHRLAVGGIEHDAPQMRLALRPMDGEHMVIGPGRPQIAHATHRIDLGEIPHRGVELRGTVRIAHLDFDGAHAAHAHGDLADQNAMVVQMMVEVKAVIPGRERSSRARNP